MYNAHRKRVANHHLSQVQTAAYVIGGCLRKKRRQYVDYIIALSTIAVALAVRWPLYPVLGGSRPYLTLFGGVALSVWFARWRPAALAAVVGFIVANYVLVDVQNASAFQALFLGEFAVYALSAGFIIFVGETLHRARERAEREVIERKEAEDELKRGEQLTRSVVNHVLDAIITITEDGTIQSFNPAAERIFGYSSAEIIGRNVKTLMPEPYHHEHDAYLGNYLKTGQAKIIGIGREVVGRRQDGSTFPMDLAVSEFHVGERRYFTGIVRDITERKQTEEALQQADRHKTEFLAMLAHELRNPLAPILSAVEIMKQVPSDADIAREAQGMIERQLVQMVHLVDDLLDISRITSGKLQLRKKRVALSEIVRSAVEASRPAIEAQSHELTETLPERPIFLHADPTRVSQVVSNLLNNAAKYTEPGGHIWLTVEPQGSDVLLSVKDNGIGIAGDKLPHVFEMFTQVDSSLERLQAGLGVGLSLVKRLVEMHGGRVEATSQGPGCGATFEVRLPIIVDALGDAQRSGSVENLPAQKAVSECRILVVDDNHDAALSLSMLLQIAGNETHIAHDGLAAVEAAGRLRPDIVLLDIGLPKLNGFDACRRIREQPWGKDMILVALTGWGQDEDRRKSTEAGFNAHLAKPVEHANLLKLLQALQATTDA